MADHQPTVYDRPIDVSPETRVLLDLLLVPAGLDLLERPDGVRYAAATADLVAAFERGGNAPAAHPDYLGAPPMLDSNQLCTLCGFAPRYHLDRAGAGLPLREWHRLDAQRPNGFFADEQVPAVTR